MSAILPEYGDEDDWVTCEEDPCGTCRYCRFERWNVAELPDVSIAAAGLDDPSTRPGTSTSSTPEEG